MHMVEVVLSLIAAIFHLLPVAPARSPDLLLPDDVLDVQIILVLDEEIGDVVTEFGIILTRVINHDVDGLARVVVGLVADDRRVAATAVALALGELCAHGAVDVPRRVSQTLLDLRPALAFLVRDLPVTTRSVALGVTRARIRLSRLRRLRGTADDLSAVGLEELV